VTASMPNTAAVIQRLRRWVAGPMTDRSEVTAARSAVRAALSTEEVQSLQFVSKLTRRLALLRTVRGLGEVTASSKSRHSARECWAAFLSVH